MRHPREWSPRLGPSLFAAVFVGSVLLGGVACSRAGKTGESPQFAKPVDTGAPAEGQGVLGYNEPLHWEKGVGVRAVARGRILAISVANRTQTAIVVGPKEFRLLLPDRQYAFDPARDDLAGFPVKELKPGQADVFTLGVPGLGDLTGYALVFNYPPAEVLARVFVEPAQDSSTIRLIDVPPETSGGAVK